MAVENGPAELAGVASTVPKSEQSRAVAAGGGMPLNTFRSHTLRAAKVVDGKPLTEKERCPPCSRHPSGSPSYRKSRMLRRAVRPVRRTLRPHLCRPGSGADPRGRPGAIGANLCRASRRCWKLCVRR